MSDDPRALLESIAFGDDPGVKPADRLEALKQLRELDGDTGPRDRIKAWIVELTDEQLDRELEGFFAPSYETADESLIQREVAARIKAKEEAGELMRVITERAAVQQPQPEADPPEDEQVEAEAEDSLLPPHNTFPDELEAWEKLHRSES